MHIWDQNHFILYGTLETIFPKHILYFLCEIHQMQKLCKRMNDPFVILMYTRRGRSLAQKNISRDVRHITIRLWSYLMKSHCYALIIEEKHFVSCGHTHICIVSETVLWFLFNSDKVTSFSSEVLMYGQDRMRIDSHVNGHKCFWVVMCL